MKKKLRFLFFIFLCVSGIQLHAQKHQNVPVGGGYQVTSEGAWCWFADPRALHYENESGTINKTYIGYIDTHGNIKAMQYDFKEKSQEEVLIRSYFQPDDHDNPTFLVLPDERIMIFYSRHTDEACFYYRVSQIPGDITTLGEEKIIRTQHNTTYPSPFIPADDPGHIYLCWRGIGWHPTIAQLSLPDAADNISVTWGPYQMVKSTGARPYAKYMSNGKDKIYFTYTTGHPDNELPNDLYFNYIDIKTLQLQDVKGNTLSTIAVGPFQVDKTDGYVSRFPATVVDHPSERDWVWQVATDTKGNPVIAMVRISDDKESHDYYYARWNGREWKKTFLSNAGGHFHQTPGFEKCYSGGMAIDPADANVIYCSLPIEGKHGKVYEIVKYMLNENGEILSSIPVTKDSKQNNVRPYVIPGSEGTPLRLTWMTGEYYDWIVRPQRPLAFNTGIACDFKGFPDKKEKNNVLSGENFQFNIDKDFTLEQTITPDTNNYQGSLLQLGDLEYFLNGQTLKPEVRYKGKVYASTNVLGTSDGWKTGGHGTDGKWRDPFKYEQFRLRMEYQGGILCVYINGLLDQKVNLLCAPKHKIPTEKDMGAYLFVYFTDPTHSLFMATSRDGYTFTAVNDGKPVMAGDTLATQKGIRDPHIYRGPDGAFYMAMTDLHIFGKQAGYRTTDWERPSEQYDWGNNRGFVLMKSFDLIHWTRSVVHIEKFFPELNVSCAWAPETIYDPVAKKMMIYFTMRLDGKGKTKLYYAYTDDEFTKLVSKPEILFHYPNPDVQVLDADITAIPDGRYCMMFVAQESPGGIRMAFSDSIHSGYKYEDLWADAEPGACEAPNIWKRIGEDKWVLMYDIFSIKPHNFGFVETTGFKTFDSLGHFNRGVMKMTNTVSPKHGAIIQITAEEADRLEKYWNQ